MKMLLKQTPNSKTFWIKHKSKRITGFDATNQAMRGRYESIWLLTAVSAHSSDKTMKRIISLISQKSDTLT